MPEGRNRVFLKSKKLGFYLKQNNGTMGRKMEIDQFIKELAVDFIQKIVELFFPDIARRLNFTGKKDLNKDFYTESPEGEERFVDVLLEVLYKNPPPSVLLIHVESQQQKRFDFPARMLAYQCLIYEREIERERRDSFSLPEFIEWKNRKHLLSFAFCNYPLDDGITEEECQTTFHLSCRYTCISLPMLSAREYLQKDNSVVSALVVFMNPDGLSKPHLKAESYQKLISYRESLTQRQINQIVYALETYLTLTEEEEEIYQRLIQEVYPEVSEMITNPLIERGRQQGRQEGIQQGRQEGIQQGLQDAILRLLAHRFHSIPQELPQKIFALTDTQKLQTLFDASLEVKSLEELTLNGFFED
ncbi:DUF4351 domain-containing protein [Candidatus Poribacteria bacterium]|nr:DUF4351 domain-containing protein [Candidatus Poribacteria bacterium]